MRRGAWHQCGDRSQLLVAEQLQQGVGVGVIMSPRDLGMHRAVQCAAIYHGFGASVLIDPQYYLPNFSNRHIESYPISPYRATISNLNRLSASELADMAVALRDIHVQVNADGLIAPAVVYEAGRNDIIQLNAQLFTLAKQVGDGLGIPTYATVVLGQSVTASDQIVENILSHATAANADGWYYAFEFGTDRIPQSRQVIYRCCSAGLTLACTGKPVLHAYAGPTALLSLGFGATGVGIGHSQNLWKFTRARWQTTGEQGGGGNAPPRFFSSSLWGTIVYPDETALLTTSLRSQTLTHSPHSANVGTNLPWSRWDANKHLIYMICSEVAAISSIQDPRTNANEAVTRLNGAINLHGQIAMIPLALRDSTNTYQANWLAAVNDLLANRVSDYDYMQLL